MRSSASARSPPDLPGRPSLDPVADVALIGALATSLRSHIEAVGSTAEIDDPGLADAMAERLDELYRPHTDARSTERQRRCIAKADHDRGVGRSIATSRNRPPSGGAGDKPRR